MEIMPHTKTLGAIKIETNVRIASKHLPFLFRRKNFRREEIEDAHRLYSLEDALCASRASRELMFPFIRTQDFSHQVH